MSVGRCGPFADGEDKIVASEFDKLTANVDSLLAENRLLRRELTKLRAVIKSSTDALQNLLEEQQ